MAAVDGAFGFTVLVGNPKPRSRTRAVASRTAAMLTARLHASGTLVAQPRLVDLAELPPAVAAVEDSAIGDAYRTVTGCGLLLVASPTFKGSYTGLLKLFLDQLPRKGLSGTVAVPLMTAASPAHQHAVESYLRPLLIALGAAVPAPGVSVLEAEFPTVDRVLAGWAQSAVPALAGLLASEVTGPLLTRA